MATSPTPGDSRPSPARVSWTGSPPTSAPITGSNASKSSPPRRSCGSTSPAKSKPADSGLSCTREAGTTCDLEASPDLEGWIGLATLALPTGQAEYLETGQDNPQRIYRARRLPKALVDPRRSVWAEPHARAPIHSPHGWKQCQRHPRTVRVPRRAGATSIPPPARALRNPLWAGVLLVMSEQPPKNYPSATQCISPHPAWPARRLTC